MDHPDGLRADRGLAARAGLLLNRIAVNLVPGTGAQPVGSLRTSEDGRCGEVRIAAGCAELRITEKRSPSITSGLLTLRCEKVQAFGVQLAFDDFGTGYASLNCLTRFPVWRIKIDRSFVSRLTNSSEDGAIVRSLIAMAHNLGLRVIAEGVETVAQAEFLLAEKYGEEAQGHFFTTKALRRPRSLERSNSQGAPPRNGGRRSDREGPRRWRRRPPTRVFDQAQIAPHLTTIKAIIPMAVIADRWGSSRRDRVRRAPALPGKPEWRILTAEADRPRSGQ